MDGYQFFAAIFQSLVSVVWPVAFAFSVWLFREHLASLLPLLRVKYKDFDVSFRLEQAEQVAAALPPPAAAEAPEPTPEEEDKFEQIAKASPRAAILESRIDVQEALRSFARAAGVVEPNRLAFGTLVRALRGKETINPETSALLDDIRVIGNTAAHNPEASFTLEEARRFRTLAQNVINRLWLAEVKLGSK